MAATPLAAQSCLWVSNAACGSMRVPTAAELGTWVRQALDCSHAHLSPSPSSFPPGTKTGLASLAVFGTLLLLSLLIRCLRHRRGTLDASSVGGSASDPTPGIIHIPILPGVLSFVANLALCILQGACLPPRCTATKSASTSGWWDCKQPD